MEMDYKAVYDVVRQTYKRRDRTVPDVGQSCLIFSYIGSSSDSSGSYFLKIRLNIIEKR